MANPAQPDAAPARDPAIPLIQCPCCDFFTLVERGGFDICHVCFWEDDGLDNLDMVSGPNHITLRQARANFLEFGGCDRNALAHVVSAERRGEFHHVARTLT